MSKIFLLGIIFFSACESHRPVITKKEPVIYTDSTIAFDYCKYYYETQAFQNLMSFIDSCKYYRVGDTLDVRLVR